MALSFDNIHLQQHLVDKIQEQLSRAVGEHNPANSTDVEAFKAQMDGGTQAISQTHGQTVQETSHAVSVEKLNSGLSTEAPGDRILGTLDRTRSAAAIQMDPGGTVLERVSIAEETRVQVQITELAAKEGVLSSSSNQASKDVDTLLKDR